MKKYYFIIVISTFFIAILSCTKIGIQLDDNIVTPISVIGNTDSMVFDSLNPLNICISSSIRARGVDYEWAYTSTDGGSFYKDPEMKEQILPNSYSPIELGDTQQIYYVPKKFSTNGVKNSLSFFVKNTFNKSQTLTYKINANVSQAPTDKPILIGPKDSTLQDNNDNGADDDGYLDPDDPNTDWNVVGKRDTVGVGDFVYILGRNFDKFVNPTNTTIKLNGQVVSYSGIIGDTAIQIPVPANLYTYFVDTMKIALEISINTADGIVTADFTGSPYSPVWRPTYFVTLLDNTIGSPNDITIDANTNLMYVTSTDKNSYNTINTNDKTIITYAYGLSIDLPYGIAIDANNLYVTNYKPNSAQVYKIGKQMSNASPYITDLQNPFDILISNDKNNIFTYNENTSNVYKTSISISPSSITSLTPIYLLTEANNLPAGIGINQKEEFVVALQSNNTILKITPEGNQSILAGNPNVAGGYAGNKIDASLAILNKPYKILSDNYNSLFFTDNGNEAVRVISTFSNRIYTIGGDPLNSASLSNITSANNTKATLLRFTNPTAITIDEKNNIYIINDNIYKLELR